MRNDRHFLSRAVTKSLSSLFVISLLLPSAGVAGGLVICVGSNGNVAVELPHVGAQERHRDEVPGAQGDHRLPQSIASAEMCDSCLDIPLPGLFGRERIVNSRAPKDHLETPADMDCCFAPQESTNFLSADWFVSRPCISNPHLHTLRTVILLS
jgi:hypothetical protein